MSILGEQKVVSIWNNYYYDINLVDKDGKYVDQFCMGVSDDQELHADLLVRAVNSHERLVEALGELCSHLPETTDWSLESMAIDEARALLEELGETEESK